MQKVLKYGVVLSMSFALTGVAHAVTLKKLSMPIDNTEIADGRNARVEYSLDSNEATLVCKKSAGSAQDSIEVQYNHVNYKLMLPVTLKSDKNTKADGFVVDSKGQLVIRNEGDNEGSIFVSCNYDSVAAKSDANNDVAHDEPAVNQNQTEVVPVVEPVPAPTPEPIAAANDTSDATKTNDTTAANEPANNEAVNNETASNESANTSANDEPVAVAQTDVASDAVVAPAAETTNEVDSVKSEETAAPASDDASAGVANDQGASVNEAANETANEPVAEPLS